MLAIYLLFSLLLIPFAAAQNSTGGIHTPPSGLGPVDATTRSQWCTSQQNTCFDLCGGRQYTKTSTCEPSTLSWNCTCQNGKEPDNLEDYRNTMPEKECQQVFQVCNKNNPGAESCMATKCGTLDATTVKAGAGAAVSSSAAASTTQPATSTAAAATTSATGGAVSRFVPEMGFAAGVVAAMGVLL